MDTNGFDNLARTLYRQSRRRAVLAALVGLAASLTRFGIDQVAARKKRKRNKNTPKLNEFGCVSVGRKCRGKNSLCCSGICHGKKPKKGQKDKSRCVAHDTGIGCVPGLQVGFCGGATIPCTTSAGDPGVCDTTTGNAAYCTGDGECKRCRKDADCVQVCGEGAACARCEIGCAGGTVCVGRSADSCLLI